MAHRGLDPIPGLCLPLRCTPSRWFPAAWMAMGASVITLATGICAGSAPATGRHPHSRPSGHCQSVGGGVGGRAVSVSVDNIVHPPVRAAQRVRGQIRPAARLRPRKRMRPTADYLIRGGRGSGLTGPGAGAGRRPKRRTPDPPLPARGPRQRGGGPAAVVSAPASARSRHRTGITRTRPRCRGRSPTTWAWTGRESPRMAAAAHGRQRGHRLLGPCWDLARHPVRVVPGGPQCDRGAVGGSV